MAEKITPRYKQFRGILLPIPMSEEACLSAINYKPKPGDIFIATYPKCGTTWMQNIVMLILRKGKPFDNGIDFALNSPYLEFCGADAVNFMTTKGSLKIHLPFRLAPFSKDAKYIYVARNPKDCCVSLYHHTKMLPFFDFQNGTFDDFFDAFVKGETEAGDYFDHLISWYEQKDKENIYFTTYEKLKQNTKDEIINIAKFIGEDYEKSLMENPEILKDIIHYSSFEYMKKNSNNHFTEIFKYLTECSDKGTPLPSGMKHMVEFQKRFPMPPPPPTSTSSVEFVRKGVIGDWKNYFTKEQEERLEERIKAKTANSDVMKLWEDLE